MSTSIYRAPQSHRWASPSAPKFDATRAGKPRIVLQAANGKAADTFTRHNHKTPRWGGPETQGLADWQTDIRDVETGERVHVAGPKDWAQVERRRLTRHASKPDANRRVVSRLRRADGSTIAQVVTVTEREALDAQAPQFKTAVSFIFTHAPNALDRFDRETTPDGRTMVKMPEAVAATLRTPATEPPTVRLAPATGTINDRLAQFRPQGRW